MGSWLRLVFLLIASMFSRNHLVCSLVFIVAFALAMSKVLEDIKNKRQIVLKMFVVFLAIYIGNLFWIYEPLTVEFSKNFYLIPFAITLIPAYLAAYSIPSAYILEKANYKREFCLLVPIWASLMVIAELLCAHLFTGFTWCIIGYVWSCNIIPMQVTSAIGIYGLSFLTYLIVGYTSVFIVTRKKHFICLSCFFLIMIFGFGAGRLYIAPVAEFHDYKVKIVQGNISQKEKIDFQKNGSNLRNYLELTKEENSNVDMIIWPEVAFPWMYNNESRHEIRSLFSDILGQCETFIFGSVRHDENLLYYNSAVIIRNDAESEEFYDKCHLLPFGEYIPCRDLIPFASIANDLGSFSFGENNRIFQFGKSPKFILQICYEAIFPIDLDLLKDADCIINITNDGWFGNSFENIHHHYIARAMAIEYKVPFIRVNNHGYSGVFDCYGRTISEIKLGERGYRIFKIPKRTIRGN